MVKITIRMTIRRMDFVRHCDRFIAGVVLTFAAVLLAACRQSPPTFSSTPEVVTPMAVATTVEVIATATAEIVATLPASATPRPPATSIPLAATATPNLADTWPPGYIPHAALHRVAPPVEYGWFNSDFQWEDDDHLRYRLGSRNYHQTECVSETWGVYTMFDTTEWVSETLCFPELPDAISELANYAEFTAADIEDQALSPDGTQAFVLTRAMTTTLPPLPKIGTYEPEAGTPIRQGWLVNLVGGKARPAFYTTEIFDYEWSADGAYLTVVGGACYGGSPPDVVLGGGIHSVAVQTLAVHTINADYTGRCEGGVDLEFSPDGQHVIYPPGIVSSLDAKTQDRVCTEDEYSRSYTWSDDGRYAYVACGKESDTLHRYDTATGENIIVVDREEVFFQAIRMRISPSQNYMAFRWSSSTFVTVSPYDDGIWILDLSVVAGE